MRSAPGDRFSRLISPPLVSTLNFSSVISPHVKVGPYFFSPLAPKNIQKKKNKLKESPPLRWNWSLYPFPPCEIQEPFLNRNSSLRLFRGGVLTSSKPRWALKSPPAYYDSPGRSVFFKEPISCLVCRSSSSSLICELRSWGFFDLPNNGELQI